MKEIDSGIRIYVRELGQIPLLTQDQEIQLAQRVRRGDQQARKQLIEANLRLVVKAACDYESLGLPLLDLVSEGHIGLVKAVEKFNSSRSVKFSAYAAWWIKQSIKRALANRSGTLRLPHHILVKISKMRKTRKALAQKTSRDPINEDAAGALDIPLTAVSNRQSVAGIPFSLDAPVYSKRFDFTKERVGQIQKNAIEKFKTLLRAYI